MDRYSLHVMSRFGPFWTYLIFFDMMVSILYVSIDEFCERNRYVKLMYHHEKESNTVRRGEQPCRECHNQPGHCFHDQQKPSWTEIR